MDELKRRHTDTPIIVEMNPRPISPRKIVPTRGLSSAGNAAPDRKIVLRPTCRNATNCPWGMRRREERLEVRKRLRGSGMAAQRVIRRFRGCGRDWHVMRESTSRAVASCYRPTMAEHPTASWQAMQDGSVFYRQQRLYTLDGKLPSLGDCVVAGCRNGGPLGAYSHILPSQRVLKDAEQHS
jgi:hypothetical protein